MFSLRAQGKNPREIGKALGISHTSVYAVLSGTAYKAPIRKIPEETGRLGDSDFRADPIAVRLANRPEAPTLEEIGAHYNLTRERIRQIENNVHAKLGPWVKEHGIDSRDRLVHLITREFHRVDEARRVVALLHTHFPSFRPHKKRAGLV